MDYNNTDYNGVYGSLISLTAFIFSIASAQAIVTVIAGLVAIISGSITIYKNLKKP